jgi:uncharacterized membrane protein YozB (DUF420 family)
LSRSPLLFLPVIVAAVLIVYGRANRHRRWGNWLAVAGYALLAVTGVIAFVLRS